MRKVKRRVIKKWKAALRHRQKMLRKYPYFRKNIPALERQGWQKYAFFAIVMKDKYKNWSSLDVLRTVQKELKND